MDTFEDVGRAELLLAATTTVASLVAAVGWRARRAMGSLPIASRALLSALPEALGDAVLLLDEAGTIVWASDAMANLAGAHRRELVGRDVSALSPDLATLERGLARGPASGIVSLSWSAGAVRARAALARVSTRPPRDVVVLRPLVRPPPLRRRAPDEPPLVPARPDGESSGNALSAVVTAVREPLSRALRGASLLRLAAPPLPPRAAAALVELEGALQEAERRAASLATAASGVARGRGQPVDLLAVAEDVALAVSPRAEVRLRGGGGAARAVADERLLRLALRELLEAVAAPGRTLDLAVAPRPDGGASIEFEAGDDTASAEALARALLAPHGGRVEDDAPPGRTRVVRVVLAGAT